MHHEDWEVFYMKKKMAMLLALTLSLGCMGTACGSSKTADADSKKKNVASVTTDEVSEEETLLSGSHIAVVGSTLTVGNGKTSYTDYLEKKNGMTVDVFATRDATLTGDGEQSYKAQLDAMDKDATWDMILVEIPPTETDKKAEVGELSESEDRDTYDLETLTGAYQYIVSYCWETWKAPVVFVTGIQEGKKDNIYDMRQAVWPVKYGMDHAYVMDLWEKLDYKDKNISTYKQKDGTLSDAGYMNWYGPTLQTELIEKYGEVASDKINELPQYDPANVEALADSPLKGKKIIFLGSSVTFGSNSNEASFVEYLAARDGIAYVKEAVSGTTLVDNGETSYIARMKANIPDQKADLFICQLSTNDATTGQPMGEISDSKNMDDFDTTTVAGAMEYIIAYADQHYGCPVMFYTGTKYDSEQYGEMVELTKKLQEKWGIGIIDMWDDLDADIPEYHYYMANGIHPNRAGYLDWWTPFFEQEIEKYLDLN